MAAWNIDLHYLAWRRTSGKRREKVGGLASLAKERICYERKAAAFDEACINAQRATLIIIYPLFSPPRGRQHFTIEAFETICTHTRTRGREKSRVRRSRLVAAA